MTALEFDSWSSAFLKRHCMYSTGDLFKWACGKWVWWLRETE